MYGKITKIITLLSVLILTACSQTSVRHHQDFQEVAKNIESVVILPAQVEVQLINFDSDNEILEERSELIKKQIKEIATLKLKSENLEVIEFNFAEEIAKDAEFAYAVTQVKESWETAKQDMYETGLISESDKAKFQTDLGDVLNAIQEKTGADSALLLTYSAFEKSEGMIAKDVASSVLIGVLTMGAVVPIQATEGAFIDVALIDASSGKVIWANRKHGAAADSSPAEIAFGELPDLEWKSELEANEKPETTEKVQGSASNINPTPAVETEKDS